MQDPGRIIIRSGYEKSQFQQNFNCNLNILSTTHFTLCRLKEIFCNKTRMFLFGLNNSL